MTDFGKLVQREAGRVRRQPAPAKPFDYLDAETWPEEEEAFKDALWAWMVADRLGEGAGGLGPGDP